MRKGAFTRKNILLLLTVLLALSLGLIVLVGCFQRYNLTYLVPEIGFSQSMQLDEGESYTLEIPYYAGHYFIQYEDEDEVAYTDNKGKSLAPFDGNRLTLYGKYGEILYTIVLARGNDVTVPSSNSDFYNYASRSYYVVDKVMPTLPVPSKPHYDFVGWYYLNKEEQKVLITDENCNYLDGFDTFNTAHYYLTGANKNETFTLYPEFKVKTYNVTFEYFEGNQTVRQTLPVPEAQYLDEVAPVYVDSDGNEHMRSWYLKGTTASLEDESKYSSNYVGYTEDGLEVYALNGLYVRKHFCEIVDKQFNEDKNKSYVKDLEYGDYDGALSSPYIYEFYTLDSANKATSYFYITPTYSHGHDTKGYGMGFTYYTAGALEIHSSVKEAYIIESIDYRKSGFPLIIETIHVAQRSSDLEIHFQPTHSKVTNAGTKPLVDASEMAKEYTLTVYFDQSNLESTATEYSFSTKDGADGADGYGYGEGYQIDDDYGHNGETGDSGVNGYAVIVANTLVLVCKDELPMIFQGGNGGNAGAGGQGQNSNGPKSATGGNGGYGGFGGRGGNVFEIGNSITFDFASDVTIIAGNGGNGGNGGRGGHGEGGFGVIPDNGGDGGNGGNGGGGGRAIAFGTDADTTVHILNFSGKLVIQNGSGGNGGNGGAGGNGGKKALWYDAGLAGHGGSGGDGGDAWKANYEFDQEIDATQSSRSAGSGGKVGKHGSDSYGRTNDDESFPPVDGSNGRFYN